MSTDGLVVVSLEPWDEVWRRNQYLVTELLRADDTLRVLFVEPPYDVSYALALRAVPRRGLGLRPGPGLDGVDGARLWLHEGTKLLPRRVSPGVDRRRAGRLLGAAHRLGMHRPTLWINDLGGAPLTGAGLPCLYDVTDDWLAADRPGPERDRLAADESVLLERCDVVTVCSPALVAAKGATRPVRLVTNGVDVARYATPASRPADLPPGPVALYVGTLHVDRLDLDLCVRTAAALAGHGTLVFVGPAPLSAGDLARLRAAGALVLGARPSGSVPGYLQHADALVVPHLVDDFTESLDPIKLYEYLAVGRPVVSTPVAGFRDAGLAHVSVVARDAFPAAVVAAATAGAPCAPIPADLPTWTTQAALMRDALESAQRHATPASRRPR